MRACHHLNALDPPGAAVTDRGAHSRRAVVFPYRHLVNCDSSGQHVTGETAAFQALARDQGPAGRREAGRSQPQARRSARRPSRRGD